MTGPAPDPVLAAGHAPLLIHVGYHKTGTTWLQTGLFREQAAGFARPWISQPIREHLVLPDDLDFDPVAARRAFEGELVAARRRGLVPVLSDERLSGSPHAGGFDGGSIARRLRAVFPEARVLVVLREQRQAIYSVYQQYVRDGGAASLENYLAPRRTAEVPQFRFAHFEYHRLIGRYHDLFGRERVLVAPFEWLPSEPERLVGALCAFAGLAFPARPAAGERYASLGALTVALKRRANALLVRNALNPAAPLYVKRHEARFERLDGWLPRGLSRPLERRLRARVERVVGLRYAASNRATADLTGLDLASLGYPTSP